MKRPLLLSLLLVTIMAVSTLAAETPTQLTTKPHAAPASDMPNMGKSDKNAEPISGTVLESMNNGGYSYVLLRQKNGVKIWVAVTEMPIEAGSKISFKPGIVMTNFESKGLKRTFDAIVFSDGPIVATEVKNKQEAPTASKGAVVAKDEKISVAKATGPNAITVAEAFINSEKLDKKRVVVRGKVVKVSGGIMKRNWIHIQDGTGSSKKGTNNLVCTSKDMANVGDVITVSGTLAKDRDFGSGYSYKAIIENATFKK